MASDDRPKLPRATLRDEKLYIEGKKEPYFLDRTNDCLAAHRRADDPPRLPGSSDRQATHGILTRYRHAGR
jgi:hypothetical protein